NEERTCTSFCDCLQYRRYYQVCPARPPMRRCCLLCFSVLVLAFAGCSRAPDFWAEAKPGQKKILVSFPPLYCLTHAIAGDDAYVLCLLNEHGPHEYDGGSTDLIKLDKADLLIYNGLTLDDTFIAKMRQGRKNSSLAVLNLGAVLEKDHHGILL